MIHARPEYDAIQPWPVHRPHLVKSADDGRIVNLKGTHDRTVDEALDAGTIAPLIPDDEPVILIRGQDILALAVLDVYIDEALAVGVAADLINQLVAHRERIAAWQAAGNVKVPDLAANVPPWPDRSPTDHPDRLT